MYRIRRQSEYLRLRSIFNEAIFLAKKNKCVTTLKELSDEYVKLISLVYVSSETIISFEKKLGN